MARIHVVSDFHLEFVGLDLEHHQPDCDVVVVAGDVYPGPEGIGWLASKFSKPVIYIAGNHEYYVENKCMEIVHAEIVNAEKNHQHVNFIQNEVIVLNGIRYIGATLWTDFNLYGTGPISEFYALEGMNDFYCITWGGGYPLNPNKVKEEFRTSLNFIVEELEKSFNGPTVVVTHHLPSELSVAPQYVGSPLNPCFGSNLNQLIEHFQPDLWIHGHTHANCDYTIGKTRILCNPFGYRNRADRNNGKRENWDFIPDLVVDV